MADEDQNIDEENEETVEEEAAVHVRSEEIQPKANLKPIYIFMILNTVILTGLAVMLFMKSNEESQKVDLEDIKATQQSEQSQGADSQSDAEIQKSHFIKESFTVNLAGSKGQHYAKLEVAIEVDNKFVLDEVIRIKPKIRDFIVVVLSSKSFDQVASVDGRDFLREEIRNKVNGYLTKGEVKDVLFEQFIIQ